MNRPSLPGRESSAESRVVPLFQVDLSSQQLVAQHPVSFASESWQERRDLQPLVRDHPSAMDPDLMIIAEEFGSWEDSARRIDLLGPDRQGNLVVIELKRVEEGAHLELQGPRYAAMVSAMDFERVVRTYEAVLTKRGRSSDGARAELTAFLETPDPVISTTPRLVLVAPSFSREVTTTVLWLNERGLDIRCLTANLYRLGDQLYLDIDQVIPLPSASDYVVRPREKAKVEQAADRGSRRERTIPLLVEVGALQPGSRVGWLGSSWW